MGDWIKIHRAILEHPVFYHDGMFRLWVFLLLRANWKPARWLVPGTMEQTTIERGQLVTGRETLFQELYGSSYTGSEKPTSRTVWRWLETLKKFGCVTLKTMSNRCTLVTIVNYETYQQQKGEDVQPLSKVCPTDVPPVSSRCPADVPPVSTIEESNKSKKGRREEGKKVSADADIRTTWMTAYNEIWKNCFGGDMAFGKEAKSLSKLQDMHGSTEVQRRWKLYCEANEGQGEFASGAKFAQTWGQWDGDSNGRKAPSLFRGLEQFVRESEGRIA